MTFDKFKDAWAELEFLLKLIYVYTLRRAWDGEF